MQPSKRTARLVLLLAVCLAMMVGLGLALNHSVRAADPPNQPFDLIYAETDVKYRVVQTGTGTFEETGGIVTGFEVGDVGDTVVKAYLLWAGLGRDDTVTLQRVGAAAQTVTATRSWNNDNFPDDTWDCCTFELSVYLADITAQGIVLPGRNDYTVSDFTMTGDDPSNWGYSLIVVYEDLDLPQTRDVYIKIGNDGIYHNWTGLLGPNSDVQCIAFEPSTTPRQARFEILVGGVENDTRTNALWGGSGVEDFVSPPGPPNDPGDPAPGTWTQNQGLIHLPDGIIGILRNDGSRGGIQIDGPLAGDWILGPANQDAGSPFFDRAGDEWDDYPAVASGQELLIPLRDGASWACLQVESASEENRPGLEDTLPPLQSPTDGLPASIGFLGMGIIIEQVDAPAIVIEKATNGEDADNPTGPQVEIGGPVTWTYVVTNTGTTTLTQVAVSDDIIGAITCPETVLAPGASMTCTADGIAGAGQYANIGSVTGIPPTGPAVTDTDPSHYFGVGPDIVIEKATNGEDADTPTGPEILTGGAVTWTYVVTNTGDVTLSQVAVTDDIIGPITCPQTVLAPNASMTCTANGTATAGQYANVGDVIGISPAGTPVTDTDPSHYFGLGPGIVIEKATNGEDADTPTGPEIGVGDTVTWTYVVTNTGTVTLTQVAVEDDVIGPITCPQDVLAPNQSMICTATGAATAGQYANLGSVTGIPPAGPTVTDTDPSHYFGGGTPAIDIEKSTNGEDADTPTGPFVPVGGDVTWIYLVTNTGNVSLSNVAVTDDVIGPITCPQDTLAVGDSFSCRAEGTATAGQYANNSTVVGTSPAGQQVTDADPSHYFGSVPAIDIEKATNGEDADTPTGPQIQRGDPVVWTYEVTNIGNVPLTQVAVTDDIIGPITCPQDTLNVGDSFSCTANGTAEDGQYENLGSVVGVPPVGPNVTDTDPSHYIGVPTAIDDPDAPELPDGEFSIYLPIGIRP